MASRLRLVRPLCRSMPIKRKNRLTASEDGWIYEENEEILRPDSKNWCSYNGSLSKNGGMEINTGH